MLSERATDALRRGAREGRGVHQCAATPQTIVFTRGTTEGINLVAQSYGAIACCEPGDEMLISGMEHHSNIVPVADRLRADRAPSARGADQRRAARWMLDEFDALLSPRTRIVARRRMSRTRWARSIRSGRSSSRLTRAARSVLVDGAQARAALAGRRPGARLRLLRLSPATSCTARPASACFTGASALLEAMPPYQGGGDMIARSPSRGRPGTSCRTSSRRARRTSPASIGLGAAIDYIVGDRPATPIAQHEDELLAYATAARAARSPACA